MCIYLLELNCCNANNNSLYDSTGKFAMKDLVYKLPGGTEGGSGVRHSDPTVIAVLNTIRVLVDKSADNVKYLRESAGIERITTINKKFECFVKYFTLFNIFSHIKFDLRV